MGLAGTALCTNASCPLRDGCWRYLAKPGDGIQVYARWEPQETPDGPKCEGYLTIFDGDDVRTVEQADKDNRI